MIGCDNPAMLFHTSPANCSGPTRKSPRRSCHCPVFRRARSALRGGRRAVRTARSFRRLKLRRFAGGRRRLRRPRRLVVKIFVAGHVARQLRPGLLLFEGLDHPLLDHLPAGGIDGVGDVGVELGPAFLVLHRVLLLLPRAALIAERGPQMVLAAALRAMAGELATGHGHERPGRALDDFQVADDEGIVQGNRAEGLQALA